MHNHSHENEFNLHVNEISFSYEKMGTKTLFEEEAKGNSEIAYSETTHQLTLIIFNSDKDDCFEYFLLVKLIVK